MITLWLAAQAAEITLTYDESLERAVEANPSVQRARLDVQASTASVRSSLGFLDPVAGIDGRWRTSKSRGFFQGFPFESDSRTWDIGSSISGQLPTGTSYALNAGLDRNFSSFVTDFGIGGSNERIQDAYTSNLSVSLTQQLLRGHRMAFNLASVRRSKANLSATELRAQEALQDTLADTARAYWAWFYQEQLAIIAEQGLVRAEEALRVADLKLDAGQIAPLEQTRAKAAAVQARVNRMEAELNARQALQALLNLQGTEAGEDTYLPGSEPTEATEQVDPEQAVTAALGGNPGLIVARQAVETAEVELANARHATLPSLAASASAGIGAQDDSVGRAVSGIGDEDAFPYLQVGADFSMPLGNRAARGEASRTAVELDRARLNVQELERNVRTQVLRQVDLVNSGTLRVELAATNAQLATEALAAEEALYEAGNSIQQNVLDARTEVTRTAAELAKARTDHQLALVELKRLQGTL